MRHLLFIGFYVILLFLLFFSTSSSITTVHDIGFVKAYFCQETHCAKLLTDLLQESNTTMCAFYDLNEPSVLQTIVKQNASILLFDKNYDKTFPENVQPVKSRGLMHNKFCEMDNEYVLTGSWNPTARGTNLNDNYVLFFSSEKIAKQFSKEYQYVQTRKNPPSALNVNLSGTSVSLYFCPLHHCEQTVLKTLQKAHHFIYVLAFSFTSKPLATMLVNESLQGINISVVFEKTRIATYSVYDYLQEHNISVFKDANPYTMHEKLFIIDNKTIVVGSYNPTHSADTKNDENLLIIENKTLAKQFYEEFSRIQNLSKQQN